MKKGGLVIIIFLVVSLLVAWLMMTQMGKLGFGIGGAGSNETGQEEQDPVDAAKDAVDQYKQALDQRTEGDD